MAQNDPWWKKAAKGTGSFVANEFLGVDDFRRAYGAARSGDWGKAAKSLGTGLFELGTTVVPQGKLLGKLANPLARSLVQGTKVLDVAAPTYSFGQGILRGATANAQAPQQRALQTMTQPARLSGSADTIERRLQTVPTQRTPAGFTTADRYEQSLTRQTTPTTGGGGGGGQTITPQQQARIAAANAAAGQYGTFKEALAAMHPNAVAKFTSDGTGLSAAEMAQLRRQFPNLYNAFAAKTGGLGGALPTRQPGATTPAGTPAGTTTPGSVATGGAGTVDAGAAPVSGVSDIGGVGSTGGVDGTGAAAAAGLLGPDAAAQAAYEAALLNAQRALGGTQNQLSQYRLQGELADAAAERAARGRYIGSLVDAESAAAENLLSASPAGLGLQQQGLGQYLASQLGSISQGAAQRAADVRTQTQAAQQAYESAIQQAKLARLQNQVDRTRERSLNWLNLGGMI